MLEFPQTGKRFVGRDTFTEWRSQHPVSFDDVRFRVVRVTARDDFAAVEITRELRPGRDLDARRLAA